MSRVLLIVDDLPEVGSSSRRLFKHSFDAVHCATTPERAETVLTTAEPRVTHLLCDFNLGDGVPNGMQLIQAWRALYPELQLAALYSAADIDDLPAEKGVDKVFRKPVGIAEVERFFAAEAVAA